MKKKEAEGRGTPVMELGPILRSMKRSKVRFGLIVLEVALTLAVVANCITMIVDAKKQMAKPSGFDDENILSVRSIPFDPAFREDGYLDNSLRQDAVAIRATPGVRAATITRFLPWQGGGSSTMLKAFGPKGEMLRTQIYAVDEGFLDTLGTHLVEGRSFTHEDVERDTRRIAELSPNREKSPDGTPRDKFLQDILITRAYGRLVFGESTALLGKLLEDTDGDQYRIIGVVDPFYNPYGWPIHDYAVFYAVYSRSFDGGVPFLVRTEPGRRSEVMRSLEVKLLAANGGRNVRLRPLIEVKNGYFNSQRAVELLMSMIVVLLVVVTSLGIVGLTSFTVAERTRTIGTRRALGASRADILKHFLLENWLVTTMGLALGVVLTYALNMGLVSSVSTAKMSWLLPAGGVVLLWLAGLAATLAPALRAARISPAIATRNV
jgi:putative ABC transport system permease protein